MKNLGAILFWTWTLCLFAFLVYLLTGVGRSSLYEGQSAEINIRSRQTIVIPQTIDIKAASIGYFLIDNREGSIVFGEKVSKPIGWAYPEYWFKESIIEAGS